MQIAENFPHDIEKYLKKFSFDQWSVTNDDGSKFNLVIVVPAIAELTNLKVFLDSIAGNVPKYFEKTAVLFVINNSEGDSVEIKKDNKRTLEFLWNLEQKSFWEKNRKLNQALDSGLKVRFIDAATEGRELPDKDAGVGLARKIGMDLALTLFDYQEGGKNIIACSDTDCTLESNYITALFEEYNNRDLNVANISFTHRLPAEKETQYAIVCYEIFLRYYVLGLRYAGSPYAFHTIGSTISCTAGSYVKIQGMKKRQAAEDFYFLEKLAKNFEIAEINTTKVYPAGRPSWRVPFGTGQRVSRYLSGTQDEYQLYSPKSFEILKKWLNVFHNAEVKGAEEYLKSAEAINKELYNFLTMQKFAESWEKILRNSPSAEQLNKQKMFWFDGFKTLKLIHHLRDTAYPNEPMFDAVDQMLNAYNVQSPPGGNGAEVPSLEIQLKYLEKLRGLA